MISVNCKRVLFISLKLIIEGVAFFDAHALQSFIKCMLSPSISSCVQFAYDFFHYLFRDRILDLQAAFPPDTRMVDKNGVDKGPFWVSDYYIYYDLSMTIDNNYQLKFYISVVSFECNRAKKDVTQRLQCLIIRTSPMLTSLYRQLVCLVLLLVGLYNI